jgi:glyoxylase-like metal-dependent hydrolase (beta-lactamase superfamily II)
MVPDIPPSFRRLQDGDRLRIGGRDWRCISGYGHAPEHIRPCILQAPQGADQQRT